MKKTLIISYFSILLVLLTAYGLYQKQVKPYQVDYQYTKKLEDYEASANELQKNFNTLQIGFYNGEKKIVPRRYLKFKTEQQSRKDPAHTIILDDYEKEEFANTKKVIDQKLCENFITMTDQRVIEYTLKRYEINRLSYANSFDLVHKLYYASPDRLSKLEQKEKVVSYKRLSQNWSYILLKRKILL